MPLDLNEVYNIERPIYFNCSCCEKEDNYALYKTQTELLPYMIEHHVCYECAFWLNIIDNPIYGQEIVDGHFFVVHPSSLRPYHVLNFYNGREFYIRHKKDGSLLKSNNVEYKGEIPTRFRKSLPDTADFLVLMHWQKLKNTPFTCASRGCWDRYNCLRYDQSIETDGPFNVVPKNHAPGSENCPSFATKTKFTYE